MNCVVSRRNKPTAQSKSSDPSPIVQQIIESNKKLEQVFGSLTQTTPHWILAIEEKEDVAQETLIQTLEDEEEQIKETKNSIQNLVSSIHYLHQHDKDLARVERWLNATSGNIENQNTFLDAIEADRV